MVDRGANTGPAATEAGHATIRERIAAWIGSGASSSQVHRFGAENPRHVVCSDSIT
jgi:hypothetical protein